MGQTLPPLMDDDKDIMSSRFTAEEHEPGLRTVFFLCSVFTLRDNGFIVGTVVITVFVGLKSLTIKVPRDDDFETPLLVDVAQAHPLSSLARTSRSLEHSRLRRDPSFVVTSSCSSANIRY